MTAPHIVRRTLAATLIVVAIALLAGFAVLYTAPFEGLRRDVVASGLSQVLDAAVEVRGPIDIGFGFAPKVSIQDVAAADDTGSGDLKDVSIKSINAEVPLLPLLIGQVQLNALSLEGLKAEIDVPQSTSSQGTASQGTASDAAPDAPPDGATARAVETIVRSPFAQNFVLRDARIDYVDQESGITLLYTLDSVTSATTAEGGVELAATGQLNGEPWKLNGAVEPPPRDRGRRAFDVDIVHAGLTAKLAGVYAFGAHMFDTRGDTVDMTVTASAPNLMTLLAVYEIQGDLEGTGDLSAHLKGRLDALALSDLALKLALADGDTYKLAGGVENLSTGTGLGLTLEGTLTPKPPAGGETPPMFDISITGFEGRITGALDGVLLRDFRIHTKSVGANLGEIGPITAERLYKDRAGQLGLYDVLILAGDPNRPSLRISGTVKDIIDFKGVDLKGRVDFLTADLFDLAAEDHADDLGHLTGTIALSDADGSLGIESFSAKVTDSDLVRLDVDLVYDDVRQADDLTFTTHLDIPKFQAFAAAVGSKVDAIGQVKFDGKITGGDEKIVLTGTSLTGKTALNGSLTGTLLKGNPVVSGHVATDVLYLSDLHKLASINSVYRDNVDETDTDVFDYAKVWEALRLDVDVKVAKISGGGTQPSQLAGHITYFAGVIGLDPLSLTYLGGRASANGKIDTKGKQNTFALKGRIENLPIGAVLKALEAGTPVRGALHASYDLSGAGDTAHDIMRSLSGSLSLSLRNGWIGSDLINLTGMSLPGWLLTRGGGHHAELVCAVAPFTFTNGHGTTHGLVLETRDVQVVGVGYIDIRRDTIDLRFKPQPLRSQLIKVAQPFVIQGTLNDPHVKLTGAPVANALTGVLAFPFNALDNIVQPHAGTAGRVPCRVTHASTRTERATTPERRSRGPLGLGILGGERR